MIKLIVVAFVSVLITSFLITSFQGRHEISFKGNWTRTKLEINIQTKCTAFYNDVVENQSLACCSSEIKDISNHTYVSI